MRRATVVVAGTGVPPAIRLGFGPLKLRLPLAELLYAPVYLLKRDVHVLSLHKLGLDHPQKAYQRVHDQIHRLLEEGYDQVNLIGHSQGALHVVRFAVQYPELVSRVVSLCGPYSGTEVAEKWARVVRLAGIKFLIRDSRYLQQLRDELHQARESGITLPPIHAVALINDEFVRPFNSAFLGTAEGVINYCLGSYQPDEVGASVQWVKVSRYVEHLGLVWTWPVFKLLLGALRELPPPITQEVA